MQVLGLDLSTSVVGYTILDDSGSVARCSHIDLKKYENLFSKIKKVNEILTDIFSTYKIERVYIEESLQMFAMGRSSSKVLSLLSKFNGIVSWNIYEKFCQNIEYISASTARKSVGIKIVKGLKAKDIVMDYALNNLPWFAVDYTKTRQN